MNLDIPFFDDVYNEWVVLIISKNNNNIADPRQNLILGIFKNYGSTE